MEETKATKLNVIQSKDELIPEPEEEEGGLLVDVYDDKGKEEIIVRTIVAGVAPDDLEIHISSESVTIRGKRESSEKIEDKDFFYQECFWGRFSRSIILPQEVDPDRSTAALKNGILTIRLPKLNRQKLKKIKVKSD